MAGFGAIAGELMSSSEISWVVELAVKPSLQAEFVALTEEMVAAAKAESGTLIYERFMDSASSRVIIYERYADSAAAIEHLEMFKRAFGSRQNELATRQRFWLLGNVSAELLTLLRGIAEVDWFRSIGGFSREALDSE